MDIIFDVMWGPDLIRDREDINRIYDMHALCTDPTYRGKGIAKNLINIAWKVSAPLVLCYCHYLGSKNLEL